jgi:hypothetical protein
MRIINKKEWLAYLNKLMRLRKQYLDSIGGLESGKYLDYRKDVDMFLKEWLFKRRLLKNIARFNGRALCFNCLNVLQWDNIQGREIAILPSHRIILFCQACDAIQKSDMRDGETIITAFTRWYMLSSGLPAERFNECMDNVLKYYGWNLITDEDKPQS